MVTDGWQSLELSKLAKVIDCKHRTPSYVESGIPLVSPGTIKWGPIDLVSPTKRVTPEEYESLMDHCLVDIGDLVLSRNQSIGVASYVTNKDLFVLGQDTVLVKPEKVEGRFLFFNLQSDAVQRRIIKLAGGSTFTRINLNDIRKLRVDLPPLPEQKKIAQILSTWDKAITTTEQLLANSQQQKKALRQQLLTGKKRFGVKENSIEYKKTRYGNIPKDWEYLAIKEICSPLSEKNTAQNDYPVLSCSKHEGFVDSLKYFKKKVYSDNTSGYRIIPKGCFGFPSNHIEEGSIGLQSLYDFGIVSPIYVVFKADPTVVNNSYLFAILKTNHYRQIFYASTNSSVDRRGSLRWTDFGAIHVPLPSLEEQNKIASVLFSADREIEALQQKLGYLKQEKKALMQQLLTGKRRVKVEEEMMA